MSVPTLVQEIYSKEGVLMLNARLWISTILGAGLLAGAWGTIASAFAATETVAPETQMAMPHESASSQEFQEIKQPSDVKLGVTAAGLGLIGLELWWFLGSKPKSFQKKPVQDNP